MRKMILIGAGIGLATCAGAAAISAYRTWGIDPADATRALPGDDLVPEPTGTTTRSIVVDAPPGAIWPWLAQMGYGRGGWYSYDRLDMKGKSALEIRPEWQGLAVGDIVPTDPKGGFEALVVDPSHALVMYTDTATRGPAARDGLAVAGRRQRDPRPALLGRDDADHAP